MQEEDSGRTCRWPGCPRVLGDALGIASLSHEVRLESPRQQRGGTRMLARSLALGSRALLVAIPSAFGLYMLLGMVNCNGGNFPVARCFRKCDGEDTGG